MDLKEISQTGGNYHDYDIPGRGYQPYGFGEGVVDGLPLFLILGSDFEVFGLLEKSKRKEPSTWYSSMLRDGSYSEYQQHHHARQPQQGVPRPRLRDVLEYLFPHLQELAAGVAQAQHVLHLGGGYDDGGRGREAYGDRPRYEVY